MSLDIPNKSIYSIESKSAKLHTVLYSMKNAQTIILLHGGPGVPMNFFTIVELLKDKFQVIVFEQRGTGRSPADTNATYSMDEYIEDIDAVSQYFEIEKFHIFGHSWGGLYAQIYAQKNPDRILSMFLCSPSSGTGDIWKQVEKEVMNFNKSHSSFFDWTMMGLRSLLGMFGSDKAYKCLFKQVLQNYHKEYEATFTSTDEMVENVRAEPINKTRAHIIKYPPLKDDMDYSFPVIITYGENDIYGQSKESIRKRFPKADIIEFKNSGHIPWRHNYKDFKHTLSDFYHLN